MILGVSYNCKAAAVKLCVREQIWDSCPVPDLVKNRL